VTDFISEDDLLSFEGWLKHQAVDRAALTPDQEAMWRASFDEVRAEAAAAAKVGRMKLGPIVPGEYRYAIAVREGSDLWLTLWVRRYPKRDVVILIPRSDRLHDPHATYHRDGTFHSKSSGHKFGSQKRQPLTGKFSGTEHLGMYLGHMPKAVGAVCDPGSFSGVVEIPPGILGPRHGGAVIDLVEPGQEPRSLDPYFEVAHEVVFREVEPWLVIRIGAQVELTVERA
jgi:hypothetical protein